ncbi:MAG: acyl-CoA dehydrogenase [Marmoricola sp.]|nr:acyl-CoA dehydrogenase [Marmoricola sp.]
MSTTAAPVEWQTDVDAYAQALRELFSDDPAFDQWRGVHHATTEDRVRATATLLGHLYAGGWNRFGWPEAVGGLGGDARHRAALYDELSAAGLPVPDPCLLMETLANPLVHFEPGLAAEMLPRWLRGEEWWGQGFSEPEAGSDLASLRCRARLDGENYVVSGSKLWMSSGATATRMMCLVRTGTPESRHRGLTMILIDVDSPGLSVRPVALASGLNEVAEVFFDDVVVPADRVIGSHDGGWGVAMYLLQFERAMYAWLAACVALRRFYELRDRVMTNGGLPDGATRRLGECYTDLVSLRARSAETVRRLSAAEAVGPEASVDKILLATAEISLHDLARDLLGDHFLTGTDDGADEWRHDWWYSRSATILGGSSEVQRTILADHVLKLPKENA